MALLISELISTPRYRVSFPMGRTTRGFGRVTMTILSILYSLVSVQSGGWLPPTGSEAVYDVSGPSFMGTCGWR